MPRLEDQPRPAATRSSSGTPWYRSSRAERYRQYLPDSVDSMLTSSEDLWLRLSPLQQWLIAGGSIVLLVLAILFLVFHSRIFTALVPFVAAWRDSKTGWLVLWFAVIIVGFPPLIGFATCVTVAGFVFGVWRGYLIVATATTVGATLSFMVCRHFFQERVKRMIAKDKRFEALALTLKHDGIKLLIMIRLCPLPYSLSNGAISAIPTVTPLQFLIANMVATPKLLVGTFIGSRLGQLAQDGGEMDFKTKLVSWISIIVGISIGVGTGWFMYVQTQKRARELEALEQNQPSGQPRRRPNEDVEAGINDDEDEDDNVYVDDPSDRAVATELARGPDGISLHTNAEAEYADDSEADYRDEWADDDQDASNLDDVFDAGEDEDEPESPTKGKGW